MAEGKTTQVAKENSGTQGTPSPQPVNGLAIAALVTGIIAILTGWAPFWGFIIGAAAIVLGIIGLRKPSGKGMAIAGLVTGGIGALWSLVVTVFLIITLAGIGLAGGALQEAANEVQQAQQERAAENQVLADLAKDYNKGETARFGQFEIKVNAVERDYTFDNKYLAADEGKEYVRVNVTIKNVGEESKQIGRYDIDISEAGASDSAVLYSAEPALDSKELDPGASMSGNIVYEVTSGATDLKLRYTLSVYDTGYKELVYTLAI